MKNTVIQWAIVAFHFGVVIAILFWGINTFEENKNVILSFNFSSLDFYFRVLLWIVLSLGLFSLLKSIVNIKESKIINLFFYIYILLLAFLDLKIGFDNLQTFEKLSFNPNNKEDIVLQFILLSLFPLFLLLFTFSPKVYLQTNMSNQYLSSLDSVFLSEKE